MSTAETFDFFAPSPNPAPTETTTPTQKPAINADSRVSLYDQLSSALVAGVSIVGVLVFILFMIWMTLSSFNSPLRTAILIAEPEGNDDRPEGLADDWQEPGVADFPEVEIPQLVDSLEAVTDSVSFVKAHVEKVDGNALKMGMGMGLGDIRQRGPGIGDQDLIPDWERWKIEYSATTMAEYMNILESLGVELGAVSQASDQVLFLSNLNSREPDTVVGDRTMPEAQRLYFHNTQNRLLRWDKKKVQQAGYETTQKLIVQFYSIELRQTLLNLEYNYYNAEGKTLKEVAKTVFRVRPTDGGYEYYVDEITYRLVSNNNE